MKKEKLKDYHRFLDEAGDTTYYGKGKKNLIGTNGVSNTFILGMIIIMDPLDEVRQKIDLLQNKFTKHPKLVLHISERGKSTKNHNLDLAFAKAKQRFNKSNNGVAIKTRIVFNVNYPTLDPLLNLADYFCWTIQRIFEKGEVRYYNYISDQIKLVVDLYDASKYNNWDNYYNKKNPLTSKNRISPPKH